MRSISVIAWIMSADLSWLMCAQAGDAPDRLKECARFEGMERLKCVDELLGEAAEPATPAPDREHNWIISETTSPVDYKPQITAKTMGRPSTKDAPSSISIHCRAGRTSLMMSTAASWRQPEQGEVKVTYKINDEPSVEQRWRTTDGGRSLVFQGDAVRLLRAMPEDGRFLIKVYAGGTVPYESTFRLTNLDAIRRKFATACHWPGL